MRQEADHCYHRQLKCLASLSRRLLWRRARISEVCDACSYFHSRGRFFNFIFFTDYVFVDEHNRHKRLKGKLGSFTKSSARTHLMDSNASV